MTEPAAPASSPPFTTRLHRLDRQRVWFGRLLFQPGHRGGTIELTGWRGWTHLRWTLTLTRGADVVWDPGSAEANLWLVIGGAAPLGLHVDSPGLLRTALQEALEDRLTTPAPTQAPR